MMDTIQAELKEVEATKASLKEEAELVKKERTQLQGILKIAKESGDQGGPLAAELEVLRGEMIEISEAKDKAEAELSRSRRSSDSGSTGRPTSASREYRDGTRATTADKGSRDPSSRRRGY